MNTEPMFVVVCLGVEPRVFGPFPTEREARLFVDRYLDEYGLCANGISADDHHVLEIIVPLDVRRETSEEWTERVASMMTGTFETRKVE